MASTNYKVFNEENSESRTYNDSEYDQASQRQTGVIPGMALSRMHNKMFLQWSAMSKAVADAIVASWHDCYDNDVSGIVEGLQQLIKTGGGNVAKELLKEHDDATDVHSALTATVDDTLAPTTDENTIRTLLSNLANEIKQNKGTDDWKTTPATNLATLASLAGNLASGSDVTWEGNKFTNSKLGITGLMDTNGYICFGKNFGGLILQWGFFAMSKSPTKAPLPLTADILMGQAEDGGNGYNSMGFDNAGNIYAPVNSNQVGVYYFVICK